MNFQADLKSIRAKKAHLAGRIGEHVYQILKFLAAGLLLAGATTYFLGDSSYQSLAFISLALGLLLSMLAFWYKGDLSMLETSKNPQNIAELFTQELLGSLREPLSPKTLWKTATSDWRGVFIANRLLIHPADFENGLSDNQAEAETIWRLCESLSQKTGTSNIHAGTLTTALLLSSPQAVASLASQNIREEEVIEVLAWLDRRLIFDSLPRARYGGVGRDWATGFTPTLDKFSQNVSREIERGRGHYHFLSQSEASSAIVHNLAQGTGVAIVGESGVGKTALVYSIAQKLLKGENPELSYYQIVSLNASLILSSDKTQLEKLMLILFSEAIRAKNIILFLDNAGNFFGEGLGAFDMSRVLQPVLGSSNLKIVASFTPAEYQRLKSQNDSLANAFSVVNVSEPSEEDTKKILQDSALTLEQKEGLLVSYEAVREAYRLSGLYMQDRAYPGKAISLLDQAAPYAENKILSGRSVQKAIENSSGVRVSKAEGQEVDVLLNLEEKIHSRMINQSTAVEVVASALRRGRAGVGDQKRPIGSFLFLGPTGVGKTELARSLADVYFGDEAQMVRLDMSEYQQAEDVSRLLSDGTKESNSLILAIRKQPFSVVLLDEVEKAHPNILNLLLQMLDEGRLTDSAGRSTSFSNAIVIATSNAGSAEITKNVASGSKLDDFERPLIDSLISAGTFKAELINRFDEVVLFRPLELAELKQVAELIVAGVNKTLANQNVSVKLTDSALDKIVQAGYDPQFGARPMRRVVQKTVQDVVANKLLTKQAGPGSTITLDVTDLPQIK